MLLDGGTFIKVKSEEGIPSCICYMLWEIFPPHLVVSTMSNRVLLFKSGSTCNAAMTRHKNALIS